MLKNMSSVSKNKTGVALLALALIVGGVGAQATGLLNTSSGGYLVCVNSTTKVVTHPGTSSCPKRSKKLVLGAQGAAGTNGLTGAAGLSGKDGRNGSDGKTLWNGVKDPESTWGAPGDMFINSVTKTLFGPKDLTTGWPAGVSMVGPKGDQGLIGLTGAMGPQGPGGSGPAGPAGATGPAGADGTNGANGTNGTNGANGTNGTNGANGTNGTNGASSSVYQKTHNYNILTTTVASILSLDLPAGSYIVTYTGLAYKGNSGSQYVASRIAVTTPDQNLGGSDAVMVEGLTSNDRAYVSHQLAVTLAAAGSVSLFANKLYNNAEETALSNGRLTAVAVLAVNNQ